jgi:tetratricopeptide (TPR) repeat protein
VTRKTKESVEAELEAAVSADAFAAAVAARLSANDPEVARKTAEFLTDQSELLRVQKKHLMEEHELRLSHLRSQKREGRIRRFGMRIRVVFQLFFAVAAGFIGVGVLVMIHDVIHSRSVVIEAFDISPNAAAQVPSGKIVAAGLLDVLTRIQAATRSNAEHRNLSNAWTNDIAIEVPETGISIGQIERILTARLGHDQHIQGDLVATEKGGLALTVRGGGVLPKTFTDEARNLDRLLTQAGEYVYSQSQPGLWAAYLTGNDRDDEAIHFCQAAYATANPDERPYLLNAWGIALTDKGGDGVVRASLPLFREAVRLKPDYWVGYNNIMFSLAGLGDEEGTLRTTEQLLNAAGGRPGRAPELYYGTYDTLVWDLKAVRAGVIADMESHGGIGTLAGGVGGSSDNLNIAQFDAQMHDVEGVTLRLKTTPVDEKDPLSLATAAWDRALLAEERGDLKSAAREWDTMAAAYANPIVSTGNPNLICFAALSYEKTGQSVKADAALDAVKFPLVDCYRFRGDLKDLRGDWAGAQQWYAKALQWDPACPRGTTPGEWRLPSTAISTARRRSSKPPTRKARTGPIRSKPGAMC